MSELKWLTSAEKAELYLDDMQMTQVARHDHMHMLQRCVALRAENARARAQRDEDARSEARNYIFPL